MYRTIAAKPSIRMAYLAYDGANPPPGGGPPITVEETDAIAARQAQRAGGRAGGGAQAGDAAAPEHLRAAPGRKYRGGAQSNVPEVPTTVTPEAIARGHPRAHHHAARLPRPPQAAQADRRGAARRWAPARSRSTGGWASRWRSGRCWPRGRGCASRGRTRAAAPSATATPSSSTTRTGTPTRRSRTSRRSRGCSRSTTARSPRRACSGFEYGYSLDCPTRSSSGRRSSATS